MTKLAVTLGIVGGKPVVLKDPSAEPEDHFKFLNALTDAGGVIPAQTAKGKDKAASEAYVLHSHFGVMRKRKFK
jgi:hypothetical protein